MAYDETIKKGTTSKIVEVTLRDSTSGNGKTGLSSGSVTAYYCREGGAATLITLAAGTAGDVYSSGKWAEVDGTNQRGLYQFHIPDAALASGANAVTITFQASGTIDKSMRISLIGLDVRDTVDGGLSNLDAAISTRSTFDPATDVVANVTTVATCTTNSDMRGTDGANTVAPDNTSIASILTDTNDLQTNQGNWLTATGFSTFNPAIDTVANVATVGTCVSNSDMRGTDGANTVAPDNASIAAILVDTDELQTKIIPMLVLDGSVYQYTVNALENAPSGGGGGGSAGLSRIAF